MKIGDPVQVEICGAMIRYGVIVSISDLYVVIKTSSGNLYTHLREYVRPV